MVSLAFPDMIRGSQTRVVSDRDATFSNLRLLLLSRVNELFGDPAFGTDLYSLLHSQSSYILTDIIKDEVYTTILKYMPQLKVSKNDIEIFSTEKQKITIQIVGLDSKLRTPDMYSIDLMINGED